jgi:hypothetical protein
LGNKHQEEDNIKKDLREIECEVVNWIELINVIIDFNNIREALRSRDSIVSIVTSYGLDDRGVGVQVLVGSRIFSSPRHPCQLRGLPNLLSNGYWGLFPWG